MKWWLIVYILTANGWEPGENFDGWWPIEQSSFEICEEKRDFSNQVNFESSLAGQICFACQQRLDHRPLSDRECKGPCVPCNTGLEQETK